MTKTKHHATYYQWVQFRHITLLTIFQNLLQNFQLTIFACSIEIFFRNNYVAFHNGQTDDIEPFPSDELDQSQIPAYHGKIRLRHKRSVNLSP